MIGQFAKTKPSFIDTKTVCSKKKEALERQVENVKTYLQSNIGS